MVFVCEHLYIYICVFDGFEGHWIVILCFFFETYTVYVEADCECI